jgi:hypothetical protein
MLPAAMTPVQYDALVSKVRPHYPDQIGGRNSNDILRLRTLAAKIDQQEAAERAGRPLIETATRFHHVKERIHAAKRKIDDAQASVAKNRKLHLINGAMAEMLEPAEIPEWPTSLRTVEDYETAISEASVLATDLERRAAKIGSYVRTWDTASMAEQNRSLILALADRLDRLERGGA